MSSAARIEELQKKFDENPRRYFAPLANECRKAGDLDAAIAICRAHLPQQPGHMSGHIVYGQALFEAGELAEARTVFETALGLDPENLIALRHMGDIAAREGDVETARQWYTRVLDSDPRNEEVQALLAGLGGAAPAEGDLPTFIEPALVAAAAEASEPTETPTEPAEIVFAEELESFETAPPALERSEELLDFEPTSFGSAHALESPGERPAMGEPAPGLEPSETVPPADSFTLDGFEATSFELPPAQPASPAPAAPLDLDMTGFGATGLEPTSLSIPAAPEPDAFVTETMAELYLQQGYRDRALDVYRQLIAQSPDDMGLRERMARVEREGASVVSEPFATEEVDTGMPELIAETPRVPAAPAEPLIHGLPTAMEPALVAAAAEGASAATGAVGPTIREYLAAIALGQPVPVAEAGPDATAALAGIPLLDTGGEVAEVVAIDEALEVAGQPAAPAPRPGARTGLDSLFGAPHETGDVRAADVLSDAYAPPTPPAPPAPPAATYDDADANPLSGRPARPAGNDLSLDHVFGQPRQSGPAKPTGSFSFDQFFADGAVKTPREESSEPEPRHGSDDDIEQFNSWLKGLKNK